MNIFEEIENVNGTYNEDYLFCFSDYANNVITFMLK